MLTPAHQVNHLKTRRSGNARSNWHKNKSLLLLFFRKEDSSFLKERSKELLLLWLSLPAPPGLMFIALVGGEQLQQKTFMSLSRIHQPVYPS